MRRDGEVYERGLGRGETCTPSPSFEWPGPYGDGTVGWEAGLTPFSLLLPTCLLRTNARSSAIHAAAPASLNLAVAQQQHAQGEEAAANGAIRVRARDALVSRLAAESDEPPEHWKQMALSDRCPC